jgi:glycosyltransferase A (GT-A) superfamily protein (DUF2064 family)
MTNHSKTAILIFANSSVKEARLKPFFKSEAVFSTLNSEIISKVKNTNLPYFIVDENQQTGNTFGERFGNAIKAIYNKGFDTVISVGNDTPQLKTSQILKANTQVSKKNYVLGPSQNGGFYLLALHKSHFDFESFIKLPWQTSHIRKRFIKHFKIDRKYILLKCLRDLNSALDLSYFAVSYFTISKKLQLTIIKSLNNIRTYVTSVIYKTSQFIPDFSFNKGSPTLA